MLHLFAERNAALLDAMAAIWTQAGRFAWHDEHGRLLYASGLEAEGAIRAWLAYGTLSVQGIRAPLQSMQSMLEAQAALLQSAIERENEVELLTDELLRTTDQLVALFEMSATARASRNVDNVMRTCVEQTARLTGARQSILVIRDSTRDGGELQVFVFPDQSGAGQVGTLLGALSLGGDAAIANSPDECEALCGQPVAGVTRMAFAPMRIGGRPDAILAVLDKPADFLSGDLKLIIALADTATAFLERERNFQRELSQARLRRELEIAADIQSRLLPNEVPGVPGVQVAAAFRPASEVGGDFFEVQALPGGVLAIALGDTAGKGVPAALFMAMARALLRVGLKSTRSPGEALKLLNAGLADDLSNADLFLTLFVATFDPAARELRAVNCGQSPVLLFQGGQVSEWEADSPPIGVASELSSAERSLSLQSGDVLIVMSDGFSEAHDAGGGRIGIGPLKETVLRAAGRSAADIAAALLQRAEASERDSNLSDDQTLIVLKVE
ncbi:MAG TPA: PP2C family protein-serine/threonine phosphatase [Anaerolineae bacterium]|nr:PP2C family protein-serine/threonine phosphatase [Anaerolineae bacterium]